MFIPEGTQSPGVLHSSTPPAVRPTPVGGYGCVTVVGEGPTAYLICRTERGRRGWGVHTADGTLLVSGWPTLARAVTYANRKRNAAAGAGQ